MTQLFLTGGGDFPPQQQQYVQQPIRDDLLVTPDSFPWLEVGSGIIVPLVVLIIGIVWARRR
jgi:hypothetical protein